MGVCGSKQPNINNNTNINKRENRSLKNNNDLLSSINYSDCEKFIPPIEYGKVIKVYDGDTITIASYLHPTLKDKVYRFSIRLSGIDCAELRTKDKDEKEIGLKARDILSKLVMNKFVRIENKKNDKYGRIIADVYYENINLSEYLIEKNLAVKYDGGKKEEIDWKKLYYQ